MVGALLRGTGVLPMIALCGAAHANLLTNGDFATGDLTGWSSSGTVAAIAQSAYTPYGVIHATPGAYDASFGAGNAPDDGVVSQSFATSVGLSYTVFFEYGAVVADIPQSLEISIVSGANMLNSSVTASGAYDFNTLFAPYSYTFTADAATTTLTFTDTSSDTIGVDGLLGQVSATAAPSNNAPEPSSFAVLGAGLATLGVRRFVRSATPRA